MQEFKPNILIDGRDKAGLMAISDVVQRPTLFNEASDREVWLPHHQWSQMYCACRNFDFLGFMFSIFAVIDCCYMFVCVYHYRLLSLQGLFV